MLWAARQPARTGGAGSRGGVHRPTALSEELRAIASLDHWGEACGGRLTNITLVPPVTNGFSSM